MVLLGGPGCGRRRQQERPATVDSPIRIVVTNHYTAPMEVVAVGSNISHRLGIVHPGMVGEFVLPPALVGGGTVELFAGEGEFRARSGPLLLSPGVVVDFLIRNPLYSSTASVRP
ncbi:MAG TPA: hypothetical protein VFO67_18030 [Gemmatimonadales bacterium]|nr:hypothetical protein [Gemmatimonadales bacterium]